MIIGPTRLSLFPNSEKGPNETWTTHEIIYTQNVQGLTGNYKRLDSLVYPLIYLMIINSIMVYCIKETWIIGSGSKLVRGHMVFRHNREERVIGSKGKIPGGVAIILSPTAVKVWRAA